MAIGIYKITNKVNNKCYIGQSVDINRRFSSHKTAAKNQVKYPFYEAINKYGIENFNFDILEECGKEELNEKEKYWIQHYKSNNSEYGYNLTDGGQNFAINLCKLTEEDAIIIIDMLINKPEMSQNDIASMMSVGADTISEINNGKTRIQNNIEYPIRKNKKPNNYCIECGIQILPESKRCSTCYKKTRRVVKERPDAATLIKEIKESSMVAVGRKYGVSDNAVRKWLKSYGLPTSTKEIKLLKMGE